MQSAIAARPSYERTLVDMPVVPAPRSDEHSAAVALRQALVSKLVDGLRVPTGDAWLEHWDADDRLEDFYHLLRALITVARAARATPDAEAEAQHQHDTRQKIAEHFTELADQLRFVDSTMDRAIRIIESIVKVAVPSHLRKDDAACAQRFNLAAKWYMLANASLKLIADDELPAPRPLNMASEIGAFIAGCSRLAALEAHHAAMEAARLRASQPAAHDVQATRLEDVPDDFEELERKIQSIEVH